MPASLASPISRVGKPQAFALLRPDVFVVSLVMHLLGLALPLALLQIYDRILPSQAYGTATFLIAGVGIAIVLEAILRYGRLAIFAKLGARYEAMTTMAALERLQHADIGAVERRGPAAISDALRAIGHVRDFWSGQAGAALYELPFVALYLVLIAYIGGWLAVIPLALFFLALGFAVKWNPEIKRLASAVEHESRQRQDFAWTLFGALAYFKATGAEASLTGIWRGINVRSMSVNAELETRLGWVRENAAAIGQLSTVLIVSFGAMEVMDGGLTTGALAACTMLAGRSIGPAMASLGYWSQLARIGESQKMVDDLLDLPDAPTFRVEPGQPGPVVKLGQLRIDAPDLLAAPAVLAPGEIVHIDTSETPLASRLLSAIAGLSQDDGIRVELDGVDLDKYNHDDYRRAVMLVTRQLALVPGSILNNLTLYDPRYNAQVTPLCEALGLQAHIDKLKNGVLTEVGPANAEQIDEGIYQRIAIVRALLRQPRILLLDHAASGLDIDGVKRLAAYLQTLRGKTTVLIATYKEPLIAACTCSLALKSQGGEQ